MPRLGELLAFAHMYDEVREVLKFLSTVIVYMLRDRTEFGPKIFFDGQILLYPADSSIAYALTQFGDDFFPFFEAAVRSSLRFLDPDSLSLNYYDPVLIKVKLWLIECACDPAGDPDGALRTQLLEFLGAQPVLAEILRPEHLPVTVTSTIVPQVGHAIRLLEEMTILNGLDMLDDELLHILREFMRLALNCAEIWRRFGRTDEQNITHVEDMEELTHEQRCIGLVEVGKAWRLMIENPFSDAPLHIRLILAQCDMVNAADHFLHHVPGRDRSENEAQVDFSRVACHFARIVQMAAQWLHQERFVSLQFTRLGNPLASNTLPDEAFELPLDELNTRRQASGSRYAINGLPQTNLMPVAVDDMDNPGSQFNDLTLIPDDIDAYFFDVSGVPGGNGAQQQPSDEQQSLRDEDQATYRRELTLAEPPDLVAVGPPIDPLEYGDVVQPSELRPDDVCTICMSDLIDDDDQNCIRLHGCGHIFHFTELDTLINGAYFLQEYTSCPSDRSRICETRPTRPASD